MLHLRGYEGLTADAAIDSTSGRWRCELGIVGWSAAQVEAMGTFRYMSASGWHFFGRESAHAVAGEDRHSPDWVADMISVRFPDLMEGALFECMANVRWYKALLEACGPNGVFYASTDGRDPRSAGYVIAAPKEGGPKRFLLGLAE
jgi:hypothetical protein